MIEWGAGTKNFTVTQPFWPGSVSETICKTRVLSSLRPFAELIFYAYMERKTTISNGRFFRESLLGGTLKKQSM